MAFAAIVLAAGWGAGSGAPRIVSPDQFVVSYWWGPPPEETTAQRYKEIADAGFNLVMPGDYPRDLAKAREHNLKVLDLCKTNGLRAVVLDPRIVDARPGSATFESDLDAVVRDYAKHPALYGYFVADEPVERDFARLATIFEGLKRRDPKHIAYVNLFPIVAGGLVGAPDFRNDLKDYPSTRTAYTHHVESYISTVKPPLVSYDEYDLFEGGGIRGYYFSNLEIVRRASQRAGLPFWNIVLVTPHVHGHGTYRDPSLDDLRFLMYTTLAYGARGLLYFTYATPPGGFGNAVIGADGKPTRHYAEVRELNFQLHRLAPTLGKLKCDAVYHVGKQPLETKALPTDTHLALIDGPDTLVSFLSDGQGRRYLMVVNKDLVQSHRLTFVYKSDSVVRELSSMDGQWRSLAGRHSFEADYLPGQGRLFAYRQKR